LGLGPAEVDAVEAADWALSLVRTGWPRSPVQHQHHNAAASTHDATSFVSQFTGEIKITAAITLVMMIF